LPIFTCPARKLFTINAMADNPNTRNMVKRMVTPTICARPSTREMPSAAVTGPIAIIPTSDEAQMMTNALVFGIGS
jgi:hypothetical protein